MTARAISKPGLLLLKVGGAVYAVSGAIVVPIMTFRVGSAAPLLDLVLLPPILFLFGVMIITSWFMGWYVLGAPAMSLTHALRPIKRYWRGIFGVLMMIGAAVSLLVFVAGLH